MVAVTGDISAEDVRAIEDLLFTGAWLIDHGQADQVPATLSRDGMVYGMGPEPKDHAGFTEWAAQRAANTSRQTRHVVSNTRLMVTADGRVQGRSVVTIWAAEGAEAPQLSFIGDWEDVYVKAPNGGWLVQERRLVPMHSAAG